MVKIESESLENAYSLAAKELSCSITQLNIEVIQTPSKGILGLFKKKAIIVATCKEEKTVAKAAPVEKKQEEKALKEVKSTPEKETTEVKPVKKKSKPAKKSAPVKHNDLMMPTSFVTDQEDDDYDGSELYADEEEYIGEETEICDKSHDEIHEQLVSGIKPAPKTKVEDSFYNEASAVSEVCKPSEVCAEIKEKIDALFAHACFEIDEINVCEHDENTVLIEFSGKDAALLIGKEGYRYKALSYMLYNWINAKYQLQLRLEIAEFLKNQEEMIRKYLEGVYVNIDRDSKAQTKILDGVLVQIALKELRAAYPDKYVAIRSTRDGAKFIIINSFNNDNTNY